MSKLVITPTLVTQLADVDANLDQSLGYGVEDTFSTPVLDPLQGFLTLTPQFQQLAKDALKLYLVALMKELSTSITTGITASEHQSLRQLIHFIDEGPASGFATGAYKQTLPAGDPFPTSIIWWESSGMTQKIVEKTITRNGIQMPTSIQWKMYAEDGTTVLATVTDAIAYLSNVFESTRTRTIA